jgi:uncharacterized protein YdhG (YjbR/CyaY superfamily)
MMTRSGRGPGFATTMSKSPDKPVTVDDYIAGFSPEVQAILEKVRETVRAAAPAAEELISYRIPALKQSGILVFYAAFKGHIGFYPPITGDAKLEEEAAVYAGEKGNLRFPYDQPIPYRLIGKLTKLRVAQDKAAAAAKKSARIKKKP